MANQANRLIGRQVLRTRGIRCAWALFAAVSLAAMQSGCAIAGIGAIVGKAIEDNTPKHVTADYHGLTGKSFVVLVSVDHAVMSEFPELSLQLGERATTTLLQEDNGCGASGVIMPADAALYQAKNPGWPVRLREQISHELDNVERIIIIEVTEFRLREPGNQYLWSGVASASVGVIECDGPAPEELAFQRTVRVSFPDQSGVGSDTMSGAVVATELARRLAVRSAWSLFDHTEPPKTTY